MNNLERSCTICKHVDENAGNNLSCVCCGYDHEFFVLDKQKLAAEVILGLISQLEAKKIVEEFEKDKGIPNQLRLTEGIINDI